MTPEQHAHAADKALDELEATAHHDRWLLDRLAIDLLPEDPNP